MNESIPAMPCVALDKHDRPCGADADPCAPVALCQQHLHAVFKYVMRLAGDLIDADIAATPAPIELPKLSVVYYARIGSSVKIGVSTNLTERMKAINPEELMATEPGGRELERHRHSQFGDLRTHGEWFRLHPRLVAHIEGLKS